MEENKIALYMDFFLQLIEIPSVRSFHHYDEGISPGSCTCRLDIVTFIQLCTLGNLTLQLSLQWLGLTSASQLTLKYSTSFTHEFRLSYLAVNSSWYILNSCDLCASNCCRKELMFSEKCKGMYRHQFSVFAYFQFMHAVFSATRTKSVKPFY